MANTKRALLTSVLAIVACVAMLIGSTFAWFTDTASTGVNKIQAGNLDIDVEYTLDGEIWKKLDGATDLFQKGLWEPGHTEVVALKFKNNGDLALKYSINMNIVDEKVGINKSEQEYKLSDYLKVKTLSQEASLIGDICIDMAFSARNDGLGYTATADLKDAKVLDHDLFLAPGEVGNYLIMKVYMPETVGNEANAISFDKAASIDFGLNVVATQVTYEKDSFGNTYDKDATYPVTNFADLQKAFALSGKYNVTKDIIADEQLLVKDAAVTLNATGKTIENTKDIWADGKAYALLSANGATAALTITGGDFLAKKNDCFAIDIWGGASVTIKDGTFRGNSSCVYVGEGTLTIEGGKFFIEQLGIGTNDYRYLLNCLDANYKNGTAKIIVKGGTFVNFDPSNNAAEDAGTNFVAKGYKVTSEKQANGDTWYTVIPE